MCFNWLTLKNVALRIRPLTDRDRAQPRFANLANDDVLKAQDKTVQVVSQNKYFTFDHVFGTTSTQEDIFKAVGDNMIRKFIEGYNITILAYVNDEFIHTTYKRFTLISLGTNIFRKDIHNGYSSHSSLTRPRYRASFNVFTFRSFTE